MADRCHPGEAVRVKAPWDPHHGEKGTVHHTYADCGDLLHVVAFADATRGTYYANELRLLHAKHYNPRSTT
jgi:hypothetical protein